MPANTVVTLRKGSSSQWTSTNPILASGEPGYDITNSILKIGDGVTPWNSLSNHKHSSSDISNFNIAVSGLLPTISNSGNNRILTSTGSTVGVNAEDKLTFDGNKFICSGEAVIGDTINQYIDITNGVVLIRDGGLGGEILGDFEERALRHGEIDSIRWADRELVNLAGSVIFDWRDQALFSTSVIAPTGNFTVLQQSGINVSVSGHSHLSSNITNFNSSVSGLLPVTNIGSSGSYINISKSGSLYTISITGLQPSGNYANSIHGHGFITSSGTLSYTESDSTNNQILALNNDGYISAFNSVKSHALWSNPGEEIIMTVGDGEILWSTTYSDWPTVFRESISASQAFHTHGNITNAGAIGSTSGLPIITTTSGVLTVGAFGTTSGTFCEGNDSRLSDARTPTTHASSHASGGSDALSLAASQITSGTVATARLGSGATATNFLRGDSSFSAVAEVFEFTRTSKPSSATGSSGIYAFAIPATAKYIRIECVGGGGGGGSGRRGAAGSARYGGGGGGGASRGEVTHLTSILTSLNVNVVVGAGGVGGAAVSADDTNGNSGTAGTTSYVRYSGVAGNQNLCMGKSASNGGGGGTASTGTSGGNSFGQFQGSAGGASSVSANAGFGNESSQAPSGGGGGGGISSANVAYTGGPGGRVSPYSDTLYGGSGGANTGGNGDNAVAWGVLGHGGGGGGANAAGAGGSGGSGAFPGGGGGGGGASVNGSLSGFGGNGGDGVVRITVWY